MHDIKAITEKLLPVFEEHKEEEHIEVEMRLGKHNGSFFDTNVGKDTFERLEAVSNTLVQQDSADVIVLGCAGLSVYRSRLETILDCPVVDPTQSAVAMALGAVLA